jgi:uncharacterized protein involved in exopolysaccharide biosynthesis/Mrp family chromosome partitioning ATPase
MSGVIPGQDVDIDLARLFRAIWEKRMRVGVITAGVAVLAFAGSKMISPDYQSETRLLIESRSPDFSEKNKTPSSNSDPMLDDLGIVSQVQVLQSVDLIKKVARDLKLSDRVEFDPAANPSFLKRLLVSFGLVKNPLDVPPDERVLKAFTEKLQVYQVDKSRVIGIQFTSEDPQLAAAIPNKVAQVYLSLQSGAKLETDSEAARWLEPEIATLREKVRAAEKKVADYRSSEGLLKTGTDQTLADQQLNDVSAELAKVRADLASAQARADAVRNALKSGGAVDTISDVINSPTIQSLKQQESQFLNQISDLSTSLLPGHPRIKSLRAQLDGVRAQINSETRKILSSLENEAGVARRRELQLVAQMNSAKAEAARSGEQQVDLNALEREAAAQRDLLETYLARYREAASRAGKDAAPADARIISNAVVPTDVHFPKVMPIVVVAVVASLILNAVVIMLNELFTGRAWKVLEPVQQRREDFEDEGSSQTPVTGATPEPAMPEAEIAQYEAEPEPEIEPQIEPEPEIETVEEPSLADIVRRTYDRAERELSASRTIYAPPADNHSADFIAELEESFQKLDAFREIRERDFEGKAEDVIAEPVEAEPVQEMQMDATEEADAAPMPAETAEAFDDDFSIESVADSFAESGNRIAVCISPSGDEGSRASVELARSLAGKGLRTILIDMTGTALPSRLTVENMSLTGITDILSGTSSIANCIHGDAHSDAHVIPHGTSDPANAMRGVDRLTMIVGALSEAYEKVFIECGPVNASGIERLTRNGNAEVILSLPGADEARIAGLLADFQVAGLDEVMVMTGKPVVDRRGGSRAVS